MIEKCILITGGYGFIGSQLIRYLFDNITDDTLIVNVDSLTYAGNINSIPNNIKSSRNYIHIEEDFINKEEIERIFFLYKPDLVIHLGAESHVDRSIDNPDVFIHTNIVGTFNLLSVSAKYYSEYYRPVRGNNFRFLYASTDEVYGDLTLDEPAFTENSQYKPSSPYSATKASCDHLVNA
jgi:dTDP-glucose 4,6-dehydratase